ncbi:MAG: hypothetical protein ACQETE_12550 [Bacteroidota bacterium]
MSKKENNNEKSIFEHPDVEEVFDDVFKSLVAESDRGAVLVGAEIVNAQLDTLFREISESDASNTLLNKLLDYPGPLSTFSAKSDVAYTVGLIGKNTHQSITILKRIRNKVAHSKGKFRLEKEKDRLTELIKLGPNMVSSITETASELLIRDLIERVLSKREEIDDSIKEDYPSNSQEVFNYIKDDAEVINILEEKHPRMTLGVAVALLCSMIVKHREKFKNHS